VFPPPTTNLESGSQTHGGSEEVTVARGQTHSQQHRVFDSRFRKKVNLGEEESELRFHMSENFTEGYHPSVSTPLSSVHKRSISHEHYRRINSSVNKKTTSYRHYRQNNPLVITIMDIRW